MQRRFFIKQSQLHFGGDLVITMFEFLFPAPKRSSLQPSDPLVNVIGTWGVWQIVTFLYLSLMVAWDAPHMFNMKFTAYSVNFWCATPPQYSHLSKEEWWNISTPLKPDGTFDHCHIFDLDWSQETIGNRPEENTPVIPCKR